jgi:hypothetical protein
MRERKHTDRERPIHERGHEVESPLLKKFGLTVYVPSEFELREMSDVIQPFRGRQLVDELEFWCAADAGAVLMKLIEMYGLPNAPEYHEWSQDFMDFKREGCFWTYVFQVNKNQYFYVSHDRSRVTVGCKATPDKKTCEAFFRFLACELNRRSVSRNSL